MDSSGANANNSNDENLFLTFHDSQEDSVAFHEASPSSISINSSTNEITARSQKFANTAKTSSKFGLRPWGHKVVNKPQSKSIAENEKQTQIFVKIEAVIWIVFFAWWMSLFFLFASGVMYLTFVGRKYSILCYRLAIYILYPFEKYVVEKRKEEGVEPVPENWAPRIIWYIVLAFLLFPPLFFSYFLTWFFIATIPMAKMYYEIIDILRQSEEIEVLDTYSISPGYQVRLCVYSAFNIYYFRYKVMGMNVVFFNFLPVVLIHTIMVIVQSYLGRFLFSFPIRFVLDLIMIVPITFYIGNAIQNIGQQTNYMVSAILNGIFGIIVETTIFLFVLIRGGIDDLIIYSLTGSFLVDLLFVPGISMIIGGIKYSNQRFNPKAASVSSILLFVAIIGAFSPTIFYHSFGSYTQTCDTCTFNIDENNVSKVNCINCHYVQDEEATDQLYSKVIYLLYFTAVVLPFSYIIGLVFTFKTHAHIFVEEEEDDHEGDGSPVWSISFSSFLLVGAVTLSGVIGHDMIGLIETVAETLNVGLPFLGVSLIAIVPTITEIINACKFALNNQIGTSIEIGSTVAVQTALLQIPLLIILSEIITLINGGSHLVMIFPIMSVYSVVLAVLAFNYIGQDGRTNYFIGTALVAMYIGIVASYYFVPEPK